MSYVFPGIPAGYIEGYHIKDATIGNAKLFGGITKDKIVNIDVSQLNAGTLATGIKVNDGSINGVSGSKLSGNAPNNFVTDAGIVSLAGSKLTGNAPNNFVTDAGIVSLAGSKLTGNAPANFVKQGGLDTSYWESSVVVYSGTPDQVRVATNNFMFFPQVKYSAAAVNAYVDQLERVTTLTTSYESIDYTFSVTASNRTCYVRGYYVTASKEIPWVYHMIEKATGKIKRSFFSLDYPAFCFGNENPFHYHYNSNDHEIIVMNPTHEIVKQIMDASNDNSVLSTIHENFTFEKHTKNQWPNIEVTHGLIDGVAYKKIPTPVDYMQTAKLIVR